MAPSCCWGTLGCLPFTLPAPHQVEIGGCMRLSVGLWGSGPVARRLDRRHCWWPCQLCTTAQGLRHQLAQAPWLLVCQLSRAICGPEHQFLSCQQRVWLDRQQQVMHTIHVRPLQCAGCEAGRAGAPEGGAPNLPALQQGL